VKIGGMYESEFGQSMASLQQRCTNSLKCLGKIFSGLVNTSLPTPMTAKAQKRHHVSLKGYQLAVLNLKKVVVRGSASPLRALPAASA
jgi:hypothetical protein